MYLLYPSSWERQQGNFFQSTFTCNGVVVWQSNATFTPLFLCYFLNILSLHFILLYSTPERAIPRRRHSYIMTMGHVIIAIQWASLAIGGHEIWFFNRTLHCTLYRSWKSKRIYRWWLRMRAMTKLPYHVRIQGETDNIVKFSCLFRRLSIRLQIFRNTSNDI